MDSTRAPTTQEIQAVIVEEVTRAGGTVLNCLVDEDRLYLRSVLPGIREVLPGDTFQGGVAAMATEAEVFVHPYTFRQVCSNGAIFAQAIQTRRVQRARSDASDLIIHELIAELRDAVRACSEPEAFSTAAKQMRSAVEMRTDLMLQLLSHLSRGSQSLAASLPAILRRFTEGRDDSVFGLMNAVTSVARDEPRPETRWRLEELGGAVLQDLPLTPRPGSTAAALTPV